MVDKKSFGRRAFLTGAGLALVGTGSYFVWDFMDDEKTIQQAPLKDLQGNAVKLDVPISDEDMKQMDVKDKITVDNDVLKVSVPDVKMSANVGELSIVDGVINPPDVVSVFLVRNIGTTIDKPEKGTVYLVTHSLQSGKAPGNYLINVKNHSPTVRKGTDIYVGKLHYKVSGTAMIDKPDISKSKKIWKNEKNRLVFITCLQREQGVSLQNLVIYADLVENKKTQ